MGAKQTPFLQESGELLSRLRMSLRALIDSLPSGTEIRTTVTLERTVDVHHKLAWQVFRFTQAKEQLAGARFLPTKGPFERFIQAAIDAGGSEEVARIAGERYGELSEFIKTHCGSRGSFESMLSDSDHDALTEVTAHHKNAMYEAACHLWGIRARARFCCNIFFPSKEDPEYLDVIHLDGIFGLHRQRSVESWPVTRMGLYDPSGEPHQRGNLAMLDPSSAKAHGCPILSEFSSNPLPKLETSFLPDSMSRIIAHFPDIGRESSTDLVFGYVSRHVVNRYPLENSLSNSTECGVDIDIPCTLLLNDALIHRDITTGKPSVSVLAVESNLSTFHAWQSGQRRLPTTETIDELGVGPGMLTSVHAIPRYAEMLDMALSSCGLDGNDFTAWRCRVEKPIISSAVIASFPKPPRP